MRYTHIIALVVMVLALFTIFATASNASKYVGFRRAAQKQSTTGSYATVHVIGTPKRGEDGSVITREAESLTAFYFLMVDKEGYESWVLHQAPMPTDLTHAEEVVVVGRHLKIAHEGVFLAKKILLKCPSKYESAPKGATHTSRRVR